MRMEKIFSNIDAYLIITIVFTIILITRMSQSRDYIKTNEVKRLVSIPINLIHKDPCNVRLESDEKHIQEFMQRIKEGGPLQYIQVRRHLNGYGCYEGFHRLEAYKRLGYTHINVILEEVDDREATLLSYRAGQGKQFTSGETATMYLRLYNQGLTLDEIARNFDDVSKEIVDKEIKIAYYLHPDLLRKYDKNTRDNNSIPQNLARKLIKVSHEFQLEIYNKLMKCKKGERGKTLDNWYKCKKYITRKVELPEPVKQNPSPREHRVSNQPVYSHTSPQPYQPNNNQSLGNINSPITANLEQSPTTGLAQNLITHELGVSHLSNHNKPVILDSHTTTSLYESFKFNHKSDEDTSSNNPNHKEFTNHLIMQIRDYCNKTGCEPRTIISQLSAQTLS